MPRTIKYTTDGKKVVVIGSLNSQQTIVQEIFIIEGQELPSGENFVVTSLHDAPAVSWKEESLKKSEARYERESKEWDRRIEDLNKRRNILTKELSARVQWAAQAIKNISQEDFDFLVAFISNGFNWVVVKGGYMGPKIHSWDEFTGLDSYSDLRLLSIHGRPDKSLTSYIGQYSDYSGSQLQFTPFKDYETAFKCFKTELLSRNVNDNIIQTAKEYKIILDLEKVEIFRNNKIKSLQSTIDGRTAEIEKAKAEMEAIKLV